MVPRLHYKYMERKNYEDWKKEHQDIIDKEGKQDHPGKAPNTRRSQKVVSKHKRSNSYNKKYSLSKNMGLSERNRKLSQFMHNSGTDQSNEHSEFLPTILNNTTDSALSTLKSFRYDRSSPILDMSTVMSTSNGAHQIDLKRKRGNNSHFDILKY